MLDSIIHQINPYLLDSAISVPNTYPVDSDLSSVWRCPTFWGLIWKNEYTVAVVPFATPVFVTSCSYT